MSPETATPSPWKQLCKEKCFNQHLVLIAIDEAHCIHEWSVSILSNLSLLELLVIGVKIFAKLSLTLET